jgi:glucose uptake protein
MFTVHSVAAAILLCTITMIGWGSWANTQKLAGRTNWPFELFYWDYVIGIFLFSILFMFTLGSHGAYGMSAVANLDQASRHSMLAAVLSGGLFNVANILLVVAIDAAGLAMAFPVGIGLALVIGTLFSYIEEPKGNPVTLFLGVAFVVAAIILSALAHARLPRPKGSGSRRGIVFAILAGCLMGFFYPQLMRSISPSFNTSPILPGALTPYTALFFCALGVLVSNLAVNTIFMKAGGHTYAEYFAGTAKVHMFGILGGLIWMIALTLNVIASGVAGPAISYGLGQGATLVAAIWGVVIWREFSAAPPQTMRLVKLMFVGYVLGLVLIGLATL